jgi:diguanylate cyclase (GGDEF)-like protein
MRTNQVKEKLQTLFISYAKKLPNIINAIAKQWSNLQEHYDLEQFKNFHRDVHSLCGSAGTYGYIELGKSARQLEIYLKSLLNNRELTNEQKNEITRLLTELEKALKFSVFEKLLTTGLQQAETTEHPIVYILDENEDLKNEIKKYINESNYTIYQISDLSQLVEHIKQEPPFAFIINVDLIKNNEFLQLSQQQSASVPVFCIAEKGDILTRLKAIRMGSQQFLQKPVDAFYLAKTLDQQSGNSTTEPYRILIIDDSQSLAEYYALILREAGMTTQFITNPLGLLESIVDFQPDLLLMDLYMPQSTGLELAAILRQEVNYMKIPIIFLSTEDDRFKQLSALNLGGDDFLTKPILPQHLIEAVRSRAKRASMLNYFMVRDSLTGLLNHTNLLLRLDIELARAQRQSEPLSFVMIDIDLFKKINDNYGHPVGDKVLLTLSNLLPSSLRKTDIIGRYGGEEFAIVLPNTDKDKAVKICDSLREKFSKIPYQENGNQFFVTFSVGISSYPQVKLTKNLISSADQALYIAKHNGRNQVIWFENEVSIGGIPIL